MFKKFIFSLIVTFSFFLMSSTSWAEEPEIIVSGPSSVPIGQTLQLEASTSTGIQEDYFWYLSFRTGNDVPFEVDSNGKVTGLNIGQGRISVFGLKTGAAKTFDFYTNSGSDVTLFLNMHQVHKAESILEVEIDCEVKGKPTDGTKLAVGVEVDDIFYFLPGLTQDVQWFSEEPQIGVHEVIQFPIEGVPYNTYTFYAATFDADGQMNSNLAFKRFVGGYR